MSQQAALIAAQKINKAASDESLQHSTTNAMKALLELNKHNRPGAMSSGYKSYGQFRNSEDLDHLRLKNAISTLRMDSAATNLPQRSGWIAPPLSDFMTSFRRLDTKFLREGEAGKVADEFEKKSGMKREAFLKVLAHASDNAIYPDDSQLVDKVLSRLEGFVKEIPNPEFRGNIEREIQSVPQTIRTGLVAKAVGKFTAFFAGASMSPSEAMLAPKESKDPVTTLAPPAATAVKAEKASIDPPVSAVRNPAFLSDAVANSTDTLGRVIEAALEEQKADSIFKQISKRYRILSPQLGNEARMQEIK